MDPIRVVVPRKSTRLTLYSLSYRVKYDEGSTRRAVASLPHQEQTTRGRLTTVGHQTKSSNCENNICGLGAGFLKERRSPVISSKSGFRQVRDYYESVVWPVLCSLTGIHSWRYHRRIVGGLRSHNSFPGAPFPRSPDRLILSLLSPFIQSERWYADL